MFLIDPPSLFAPRTEWEQHLARLEASLADNPKDQSLKDGIKEARENIAKMD